MGETKMVSGFGGVGPEIPRQRDGFDVVVDALQAYRDEYARWRRHPYPPRSTGVRAVRSEPVESLDRQSEQMVSVEHRDCRNGEEAEGYICFRAMTAALESAGVQVRSAETPVAHSPENSPSAAP
jgi:hypothetical protein